MQYIIADIHGCYEKYRQLLEKIGFADADTLYILGDAVDRGPEPIRVLQDMMERVNVYFIMGNHDFAFYHLMRQLTQDVTEEACQQTLTVELMNQYNAWLSDGGESTAREFQKLSTQSRLAVLDYLDEASAYEIICHKGKRYILTHAGLNNFSPEKALEDYDLADFLDDQPNYGKRYFPDTNTFLVTGHTPTFHIHGKPEVYRENGHIALDCGCVFGGKLAAYCIETGEVTYV